MSDLSRFKMEFQPSGEVRECVYASDYNAALSELSALREELAECQKVLSYSGNEADAHSTAALHTELEDTQQRLTAAEQRNAAMSKLLQRCIPVCRYKGSHTERQLINEIEEVCAKPTESGASE